MNNENEINNEYENEKLQTKFDNVCQRVERIAIEQHVPTLDQNE